MPKVISPVVGVNLTETTTDKKFAAGTTVMLDDGGFATYVSASSSIGIVQYDAVIIDDAGGAVPVTTTNSAVSKRIAFAQTAIAAASFGWVQTGGKFLVKGAANLAPAVPLYTTATAGVLDDATVSGGLVLGVVATGTISNATAITCVGARGAMIGTGNAVSA